MSNREHEPKGIGISPNGGANVLFEQVVQHHDSLLSPSFAQEQSSMSRREIRRANRASRARLISRLSESGESRGFVPSVAGNLGIEF